MGIEEMIIAIFVGSFIVALLVKFRLVDLRRKRRISAGATLFGEILMTTFPMLVMSLFFSWNLFVIPWLLLTPLTYWNWRNQERELADQKKESDKT